MYDLPQKLIEEDEIGARVMLRGKSVLLFYFGKVFLTSVSTLLVLYRVETLVLPILVRSKSALSGFYRLVYSIRGALVFFFFWGLRGKSSE